MFDKKGEKWSVFGGGLGSAEFGDAGADLVGRRRLYGCLWAWNMRGNARTDTIGKVGIKQAFLSPFDLLIMVACVITFFLFSRGTAATATTPSEK